MKRLLACLLFAGSPAAANATTSLLAEELRAPLLVASADGSRPAQDAPEAKPALSPELKTTATQAGALDFDLLGAPPPQPPIDEGRLRLRRTMLTVHQGLGLGLVGLQLATTIVGQLNYSDRFAGGPSTGKYQQAHAVLAYATLGTFAMNGLIALLAPAPLKRSEGFDRVSLHKLAMLTAAAGMVAQGVLGVVTRGREGYLNQESIATAHLVVGYVTLAVVLAGVGALVL